MSDAQGIARNVSRARAERLVAITRLLAHAFATVAAALTARDHGSFVPLWIMLPWCVVSAVLVWDTYRRGRLFRPPLLLVLDLLVIAAIIAMTGGGTSPFFPFLLITPFGAANLYGRRGMLWAGCGTLATYVVIVLAIGQHVTDPRVVIMRVGVLVIIASIIIRRADHEQRTNADLENLAAWPRVATADREAGVRRLLEHAAATLRTSGIVMTWSELDGSEYVVRYERGGAFTFEEEPAPELEGGFPFASQTAEGRLFLRDARAASPDDLRLADIVVRLVSAGLDQLNLVEMMREGAANEERLRLSRDLHDGLLQSLGGLALHVRGARRTAARDPRHTEEQLDLVGQQLIEAQRALRDFVEGLRPELVQRRDSLRARLMRAAHAIELQWNVGIEFDASRELDAIEIGLADEVVALVAEALTNAARHAGATQIRGAVAVQEEMVRVDVQDNGRGFPFHGRHELRQLVASGHGPWSLKERVTALGGDLAIESSADGARVEIRLRATS
ncbi:MAG TPA: histidine kinase [Thermoanaerobaculia bacterium]|nr:histidine kinase [Thermoanaerobaculia bacterium]